MRVSRILAALGVATLLLIALFIGITQWRGDKTSAPFMVSTANPYASEAGAAILRDGGSAVDAAIAIQAVLSLVEPQSSGLAGGAFMLHYNQDSGALDAYDGRETAPRGAPPELFLDDSGRPLPFLDAMIGGHSVGTPGIVRMMWLAHQEHGQLEWEKLFEPAIRLSEDGFRIPPRLAASIAHDPILMKMPVAQDYFYRMDDKGNRIPLQEGEVLRNPAYAETLRQIAAHGWKGFYEGPVAEGIIAAVQQAPRHPGTLSLEDFSAYEAKKREPVCAPYREYKVCTMPPPTSGGVTALQILGILENYDLRGMEAMSLTAIHFIAEAEKLAYADRGKYIGDPDFIDVPVKEMTDREYLKSRADTIDASLSMGHAKAGTLAGGAGSDWGESPSGDRPSTSHFSIVDSNGNVVSMTSSIEGPFGAHLMSGGMILNNQLTDFSFVPEIDGKPVANAVAPSKRPRSSMTPVIIFDNNDNFHAAIGSPGGSRIIGYVTQTIIGLIDWDMDMTQAIAQPRFISRNGPLEIEAGTSLEELAPSLRQLGHKVEARDLTSGLHGIRVTPKGYDGAADPRRDGTVITGLR